MTILARTGKARWCSRCGRSWQAHRGRVEINYITGKRSARCLGAEWTARGRAKRIRQYLDLAARLYAEAAKETP